MRNPYRQIQRHVGERPQRELLPAHECERDEIKELFRGIPGIYFARAFGHRLVIQVKASEFLPLEFYKGDVLLYRRGQHENDIYVSLVRLLGKGKTMYLGESKHLSPKTLDILEDMERVLLSCLAEHVASGKP